jgi:hypothetical protein
VVRVGLSRGGLRSGWEIGPGGEIEVSMRCVQGRKRKPRVYYNGVYREAVTYRHIQCRTDHVEHFQRFFFLTDRTSHGLHDVIISASPPPRVYCQIRPPTYKQQSALSKCRLRCLFLAGHYSALRESKKLKFVTSFVNSNVV